ncbi:MAG: single-stranded DNA-binding protein [SAR116 cluster bacterium]|jgi:single-strand DNA-binding protein|nr:MAG: single-stranded DNA-binding protein [SAR116 cluster bacterium]|tara:strand:- start:2858 stop:3388 length:531 start_codon:yes stop_codon:yes gene_type:complete
MAGSVNKVILLGNLGRDPEIRNTQDGNKIVNLSIATSEKWKDRMSGEPRERTEWHRVVIFNENLARIAEQYLRKGSSVYVEGQLQTRKWTDQQGVEKYTTEVVLGRFRGELTLLGGRGEGGGAGGGYGDSMGGSGGGGYGGGGGSAPAGGQAPAASTQATPPPMHGGDAPDDDIPF